MSTLKEAQEARLEALRARAADRPAHLAFVDACMAADGDAIIDVPIPKGCSLRVAEAIMDDIFWIRQDKPEEGFVSKYDNAYSTRRSVDAQAARWRQRSSQIRRDSLEHLINLTGKDGS